MESVIVFNPKLTKSDRLVLANLAADVNKHPLARAKVELVGTPKQKPEEAARDNGGMLTHLSRCAPSPIADHTMQTNNQYQQTGKKSRMRQPWRRSTP
jgi:hypothetical protein